MFTVIGTQCVKSDEGFTVLFISMYEIKYSESLGEIDIPYDSDSDGISVFVYVDDKDFYRWNDGRRIPEHKKCEILNNVIEAMKCLEVVIVVE